MKEINERDADMLESIEMWLHEIEPKWVEKELAWLKELRTRLLEEHVPENEKMGTCGDASEYIRTIKSLIADFIRDKQPGDVDYYQKIYDWLNKQ